MSASATSVAAFCGVSLLGHRVDPDLRIEPQQRRLRGLGLELADVRHAVKRLAMQVRLLDRIMIDDRESNT